MPCVIEIRYVFDTFHLNGYPWFCFYRPLSCVVWRATERKKWSCGNAVGREALNTHWWESGEDTLGEGLFICPEWLYSRQHDAQKARLQLLSLVMVVEVVEEINETVRGLTFRSGSRLVLILKFHVLWMKKGTGRRSACLSEFEWWQSKRKIGG